MFPVRRLALLSALILAGTACASPATRPTAPPKPATSKNASPARSPTPVGGEPLTIGGLIYNSHGFRDVGSSPTRDLDAGDFFFKGTFLRGEAGHKLTLRIQNTGTMAHNLSIPAQQVDQEIPNGEGRVAVDVTFPESGALRFFCKFHEARGMNGQLLVGEIEPQPLGSPVPKAGG